MEPISDISSNDPRWIRLKPSRYQLAFMLVGALVAIIVLVMATPLPAWLRGLLVAAIGLQIVWEIVAPLIRRNANNTITAFYFIILDPERDERAASDQNDKKDVEDQTKPQAKPRAKLGIRLQFKNGVIQQGEVRDGAFVMPWFATVPYRLSNDGWVRKIWPRILPLWRDRLEVEAFRQVRVQLRWH